LAYGDYILDTGEAVGDFETAMGRFYYDRFFAGRAPILDLACGRCWFLRQHPDRIHGVDLSPEIVAHYAARGCTIRQGSAYEIPYEDAFFEGVWCCWLFEHLEDPDQAMREILRVLKPGGISCIIVPSEHQVGHGFWDDYTHVRPYTSASLRQLARYNGFVDEHTEDMPWVRGTRQLALLGGGSAAILRYMRFSHAVLRRIGVTNRNMLVLSCRKPA
jgi:SAM-dependent methyltransferase